MNLENNLRSKIIAQCQYALQTGALQTIETNYELIEDQGMQFLVRILTNLSRKETAQPKKPQGVNPFLPYEPDLFVSYLSDTHLCLLNKYNVVNHHILIVTRHYEEQENGLNSADFEALALTLKQINGLGFYNGGTLAGASQKHKHLQVAPFPLMPNNMPLPLESALKQAQFKDEIGRIPLYPFPHAIGLLNPSMSAEDWLKSYYILLQKIGLNVEGLKQTGAYNLLITQDWMMVVKRSHEHFQGIPVNALGFAGTLLVKNQAQLLLLKRITPLQLLQKVC